MLGEGLVFPHQSGLNKVLMKKRGWSLVIDSKAFQNNFWWLPFLIFRVFVYKFTVPPIQTVLSHPEQQKLSVKYVFVVLTKCHGLIHQVQWDYFSELSTSAQLWTVNMSMQWSRVLFAVDKPWGQSGRFFWHVGNSPLPRFAWWTEWPPPRSVTPSAPGSQTVRLQRPWTPTHRTHQCATLGHVTTAFAVTEHCKHRNTGKMTTSNWQWFIWF